MSKKIFQFGSLEVIANASDVIALYSKSPVKIYKKQPGLPNQPDTWTLFATAPANAVYQSAAVSVVTTFRIEAGADVVYAAVGTAAIPIERIGERNQGAPGVLNATGTLTAAMIAAGIVTSTTAAAVVATLDTGAVMDAALDMEIGESFDWSVINTGGVNAFTVTAAASGHTVVGAGAVAASSSGTFRTRKTAADTFITYRLT